MSEEKKSDLRARLNRKTDAGNITLPPNTMLPPQPQSADPLPVVQPSVSISKPSEPSVRIPGPGLPPTPAAVVPPPTAPTRPASPTLVAPPGMAPLVAPPGVPQPVQQAPVFESRPEPAPLFDYYDEEDPNAGRFVLEDDEEKREEKVSFGWLKLAGPAAAAGLAIGLVFGYGSFEREYNHSRQNQIKPMSDSFAAVSSLMDKLVPRVLASKDGDVDLAIATDLDAALNAKDVALMSSDVLKNYPATFLRANTLRLLFQYQFLTTTFYKSLRDHVKRVKETKADLEKAKKGTLEMPRYASILIDNTEQGGIISAYVVTQNGEPRIEERDEEIPGDPTAVPPTAPQKVKSTFKIYKMKSGFEGPEFERAERVDEKGQEDVRSIINADKIPSYSSALLADYENRLRELKLFANTIKSVQEELKKELQADIERSVSFSF